MSSSSSCLGRASVPVKRVWRGLSARLGRGRRRRATGKLSTYVPVANHHRLEDDEDVLAGLGRLRKEVRTCEYRDVHVMWEMLSSNGNGVLSGRCGSRDDNDMADVAAAVAGKKLASPATRRARRKGIRKTAPWRRLVAYCGGAF